MNLISKKNKNGSNIFITENRKNALLELSKKLKAEVIEHKDYIGGRYAVMSEAGMLPAALMNLDVRKFKQLNQLMLNKKFVSTIVENVYSIHTMFKKKKFNSIILNYDPQLNDFCLWYQQLVSESLGKKKKGIMPIVSTMPKDSHSLLQYYLDGNPNAFFTIFSSKHLKNYKINNALLPGHFKYLSNKNLESVVDSQRLATQKIFLSKSIPFRTFEILKKSEKELGFLFTFFVLETILLSKMLKVDPFNQPAVELVKNETKKILLKN